MFKINNLINFNNAKKLIKKRLIDTKKRIYIQDSELVKYTGFKPGVKIQCAANTGQVSLKASDEGSITVVKRKRKDYTGSVIDIRNKAVLNALEGYDKICLEIYEDEIILIGLNNSDEITSETTDIEADNLEKGSVVSLNKKKAKVLRIPARQVEVAYNKILARCSGDSEYHQLNFFDFMQGNDEITTQIASNQIKNNVGTIPYSTNKVLEVQKNAIRFNSVCAGAGILDKGFIDTGFEPQWALELEKDMCDTYRHNLGDHIVQGDLSTYDTSIIPDAEVLIGGPPCQDYSNANRVTGKIIDSPKNLLMRSYIKVAKSMKSLKVFVIENVPQLLTKGKKFVDELKETMSDFEITIKKVDSSKYGCAQKRERAIIIGSKIGKIDLPDSILAPVRTVRQALAGIKPDSPNQQDFTKPSPTTVERMSYVPQGGNFLDIPEHLRTRGTHSNLFYRLEWDNVCKTLTNVRKSNIIHPEENRVPSIREVARLTGLFPDKDGKEFEFLGTLANKQQMLANAVPLELSTVIAKTIHKKFKEFYNSNGIVFA